MHNTHVALLTGDAWDEYTHLLCLSTANPCSTSAPLLLSSRPFSIVFTPQAAAAAARRRAQGLQVEQAFLQGLPDAGSQAQLAQVTAEQRYAAELAEELQVGPASQHANSLFALHLALAVAEQFGVRLLQCMAACLFW